jgi:SAM-dependent methyltransferase
LKRKEGKIRRESIPDYAGYLEHPPRGRKIIDSLIVRRIIKMIASTQKSCGVIKILEAGCGPGIQTCLLARVLKEHGFKAEITGMDIDPQMLKYARARAQREDLEISFVEGDIRDMPFPLNSFNIIVSVFVGFLLDDDELKAFFRQVHLALKPRGQFMFFNPNRTALSLAAVYAITRGKKNYELDVVRCGRTPREMERLISATILGKSRHSCHAAWLMNMATETTGTIRS